MKKLRSIIQESQLSDNQSRWVNSLDHGRHEFSDHVFGKRGQRGNGSPSPAGYETDYHNDTVYVPLEKKEVAPHPFVAFHLSMNGYHVHDYGKGLAKDKYNREVRIGKILEKTKAPQEVKDAFVKDQNRQNTQNNDLMVAYTRSPYHVAAMSTNRGWSSCMSIGDRNRDGEPLPRGKGEEGGSNHHYLEHDLYEGTHVAYLIHKHDKNIDTPIARIALKPWHSDDESPSEHTILRPESSMYGHGGTDFSHSVNKWAEKHFPAKPLHVYEKNSSVYDDGDNHGEVIHHEGIETIKHIIATRPAHKAAYQSAYDGLKHYPGEHQAILADSTSAEDRALSARWKGSHLDKLVNDTDHEVREVVAGHGIRSHLDQLVHDRDAGVRQRVAEHGIADHLKILSKDSSPYVRMDVAHREGPHLTDMAQHDSNLQIRTVAQRTLSGFKSPTSHDGEPTSNHPDQHSFMDKP